MKSVAQQRAFVNDSSTFRRIFLTNCFSAEAKQKGIDLSIDAFGADERT